MRPVSVGVIGCGIISEGYLRNLSQFRDLKLVALGDLEKSRAEARAQEYDVAKFGAPKVVLEDDSIDIIVNLTNPPAHAEVTTAALESGKSVFSEKPLALEVDDGRELVRLAERRGLLLGCAPDTTLGGGLQTARELFDSGLIGRPVSAVAFLHNRGAEQRRPDPEFYYRPGVGPMYDMGPYYLSALAIFLGPVESVIGTTDTAFAEREIVHGERAGQFFPVEVPTHVTGILKYRSGPRAVITMSCDVWATNLPRVEIYGVDGSLALPDPNRFDGSVQLWTRERREWAKMATDRPYTSTLRFGNRGLGVADLAAALREGGSPRASGALALHVLEIMEAVHRSAIEARAVALTTSFERPAPMPRGAEFVELPGSVDSGTEAH